VEIVVKEGVERIKEIIGWGAQFDKEADGDYALGKEGGHSVHRILHHKDVTGREMERALLETVQQQKNIQVQVAVEEKLPAIHADAEKTSWVLINFLTNAIKYSPEADSVEVYLEGGSKKASIQVRDHGIGIDKKDFTKIFERFYRAEGKAEQTYPGFGIGLFIASEIVQRHNGTIDVSSEKGKGSIFTVNLPRDFHQ
jgi:two-component system CheB/CheR fusion protein